jgi:hypothetical protein
VSSIGYQDGGFVVIPDECPDCDAPLYGSSCDAPDCPARGCTECGWGCDLDFAGDDGNCAQAMADEDPDDRAARIAEERAAFALGPARSGETP